MKFGSERVLVMLLALCHRCWTWMEPKHDRCVECGGTFSLQDDDPDPASLQSLIGDGLCVLGEVSLKRPKLPGFGVLSAHDGGLVFLPDLRELPTGGIVPIEPDARLLAGGARSGFWNLFSRRSALSVNADSLQIHPNKSAEEAVERFLNSPGAVFVPRTAIVRIQLRGALLRVERKPGRTLGWRLETPLASVQQQFRQLASQPGWTTLVVN